MKTTHANPFQIVNSYALWGEYVDTLGLDTEEQFLSRPSSDLMITMVNCGHLDGAAYIGDVYNADGFLLTRGARIEFQPEDVDSVATLTIGSRVHRIDDLEFYDSGFVMINSGWYVIIREEVAE